ncbi:MAG: phosphoribosylglycinamide formyltransferase [Spirochaetales bacterium]|nr:phosphoribosylglycinamide formyltransferase [Spirochaetales bacterium]
MLNIAVLVSGGGTNLQALIDAEKKGIIKSGKITLVLADRPSYGLERAQNANIATQLLDKKSLGRKAFESALLDALSANNIDMIVLAGFLSILSPVIISAYNDRIINIHPSLIPSFCGKGFYGLHVHEEALSYGVKVTGATVHLVNEIPDGGRILLQKAVEVKDGDTPERLQKRVMEEAEWIILSQGVEMLAEQLSKEIIK